MTAYTVFDGADRVSGMDIGTAPTTVPSNTLDTFPPGGDIYLRVKTGGSNTLLPVITWPTAADPNGVGKKDFSLNAGTPIPISKDLIFGPFPAAEFSDPSDGLVHVNYTGTVTGSVVAVYRATNG